MHKNNLLKRIETDAENILNFSINLDDTYSTNNYVKYGIIKAKEIIAFCQNLEHNSTGETERLEGLINDISRGYENIFKEFTLAQNFNELMDQLYLSKQHFFQHLKK